MEYYSSFEGNPFENLTSLESVSIQSKFNKHIHFTDFATILNMLPVTLKELNINIHGGYTGIPMLAKFTQLKILGLYETGNQGFETEE